MYRLFTDTAANLPLSYLREHGVGEIPFTFHRETGEQICMDVEGFDGSAFYNAMRAGERISTSQIPPSAYEEAFAPVLEQGEDVLFIGLSSGVSGSFQSAWNAARNLRERFPQRTVALIDTRGASLGEGMVVMEGVRLQGKGVSLEEAVPLLEAYCQRMCQVFTVGDLRYLAATGRLSNAGAALGNILNIKPLLKGNEEGKIVSYAKIHGRKRTLKAIVEQYETYVEEASEQRVCISHGDCPEDAAMLETLLRGSKTPPKEIFTVIHEPVTGSHVGPGMLALYFIGSPAFRGK